MELARVIRPSVGTPIATMFLMHGLGSDEQDMLGLAQALDPGLEIVCLRAPHRYGPGYAWFEVEFSSTGVIPNMEQAWESVERVADLISTSPTETIIGGFSQGAMMTAGLMAEHGSKFSRAVLLSGRSVSPKSGSFAGRAFVAHGTHDDVVSYREGVELVEHLQAMDGRLTFRDYPIGHWISADEVSDLNAWLRA